MEHTKAEPDTIRQLVRDNYGKIASAFGACCNTDARTSCCSGAETAAHRIGYSNAQIESAPDAAAMGLGCGNPQAIAGLKPGGRLAISDVVAVRPLPASMLADRQLHCACIGGAMLVADLRQLLETTGFEKIEITLVDSSRDLIKQWAPGKNAQAYVVSAFIRAIKPGKNGTC